jgi:hypothetical protein
MSNDISLNQIKKIYAYIDFCFYAIQKESPEYKNLINKFNKTLKSFSHLQTYAWEEWSKAAAKEYIIHSFFKKKGIFHNKSKFKEHKNLHFLLKENNPDLYMEILKNHMDLSIYDLTHNKSIIRNTEPSDKIAVLDSLKNTKIKLFSPGLFDLIKNYQAKTALLLTLNYKGLHISLGPTITFNNLGSQELIFFAKKNDPEVMCSKSLYKLLNTSPVPFMVLIWVSMHPDNLKYSPDILIKNIIKGFFP